MPVGTTTPSDSDLAIGAVAAGLELVAVNTYDTALDAATAGSLGDVPAAVAEFATTVRGHHQEALDAWNALLTDNGVAEVTEPLAAVKATVDEMFAAVTDVVSATELTLFLEEIASATYLDAIGRLESASALSLAGSIQPVDRQHVAILLFVLGRYPVPNAFATADMAVESGAPTASPATEVAAGPVVRIIDFAFEPPALEVAVGNTVEWVNDDAFDHTIVADDDSFESQTIEPGGTFAVTFETAGSFSYACGIHPQMHGSVTVA